VTLLFHKPYGVLSQFTPEGRWRGLCDFGLPKHVYVAGRLDADSEGLLVLTDDGRLQHKLTDPTYAHPRTYWALVERVPTADALAKLSGGVPLGDYTARPCEARALDPQPLVPPRDPPVRFRKNIPDAWIELVLREGKNRQVRRMTAAVGHPTLRLIRVAIGEWRLEGIAPGTWVTL